MQIALSNRSFTTTQEFTIVKENDMNEFLNDLANNTPNQDQFEKV